MDGAPLAAARADYDGDFFAWAMAQAALLREGRLSELDAANLAEEIESLAKRERREVISRLTILLHHLLRWEAQPDLRSRSWRSTITEQRDQIALLLEDNPSLSAKWDEFVPKAFEKAIKSAAAETGIVPERFRKIAVLPRLQMLCTDFLPGETSDGLPD